MYVRMYVNIAHIRARLLGRFNSRCPPKGGPEKEDPPNKSLKRHFNATS